MLCYFCYVIVDMLKREIENHSLSLDCTAQMYYAAIKIHENIN